MDSTIHVNRLLMLLFYNISKNILICFATPAEDVFHMEPLLYFQTLKWLWLKCFSTFLVFSRSLKNSFSRSECFYLNNTYFNIIFLYYSKFIPVKLNKILCFNTYFWFWKYFYCSEKAQTQNSCTTYFKKSITGEHLFVLFLVPHSDYRHAQLIVSQDSSDLQDLQPLQGIQQCSGRKKNAGQAS